MKKRRRGSFIFVIVILTIVIYFVASHFTDIDKLRYPIHGIDVSKHTGKVDFEKIKEKHSKKINFIYLKASEGRKLVDGKFEINYLNARKTGIPTGAYHFFRFNVSGEEQAENFLRCVRGKKFDLPLVLDVEEWKNYRGREVSQIVTEIGSFIRIVEKRRGGKIVIYTNESGYYKYIHNNFDRKIWICSFNRKPEISGDWVFWQYSHTAKLQGAEGWIDLNAFHGSRDDWEEFLAEN
jgi:lysozyme